MGAIRKTFSIGSFGVVAFRSKKEKLHRAEAAQIDAESALEEEHSARQGAEHELKRVKRDKRRHKVVAPVVEKVAAKIGETIDQL
jgi:hypothetical protein